MTIQNERKVLTAQERSLYTDYANGALLKLTQLQRRYEAELASEQDAEEVLAILERMCEGSRQYASEMHKVKMHIDWGHAPTPEWMNHYQDWFYQSLANGSTFWLERGIFARLCFRTTPKPKVLELCCGDGFNSKHFYSPYASQILALDFDVGAIKHASEFNSPGNIAFTLADIREPFPQRDFDNVVWDAAIEHFTDSETNAILRNIKGALKPDGILSGYTLVENADGKKTCTNMNASSRTSKACSNCSSRTSRTRKCSRPSHPSVTTCISLPSPDRCLLTISGRASPNMSVSRRADRHPLRPVP